MTATGNWSWSDHEEEWRNGPQFASREDAIAEAKRVLASEQSTSVESADATLVFWTGECRMVTANDVVDGLVGDQSDVDDRVGTWLYDNFGEHACEDFGVSKDDVDELRQLTRDWLTRRNLVPELWTVDRIVRHEEKP